MAQVGIEPTASLVLREGGRPVAYRAPSSGGWNRANDLLVQSQASLPAATAPEKVVELRASTFELRPSGRNSRPMAEI
jgi:hypothetical protein